MPRGGGRTGKVETPEIRKWRSGERAAAGGEIRLPEMRWEERKRILVFTALKNKAIFSLGKCKSWEEELRFSGQGNDYKAEGRSSGVGRRGRFISRSRFSCWRNDGCVKRDWRESDVQLKVMLFYHTCEQALAFFYFGKAVVKYYQICWCGAGKEEAKRILENHWIAD